jgi:hypothetical protein
MFLKPLIIALLALWPTKILIVNRTCNVIDIKTSTGNIIHLSKDQKIWIDANAIHGDSIEAKRWFGCVFRDWRNYALERCRCYRGSLVISIKKDSLIFKYE